MEKIDNTIAQTKASQAKITPAMAQDLLMAGNDRFVNNMAYNRHVKQQVEATQITQAPFAAVLCCIDSRAAAEIVFDQSIGDIFTARVAGNFVNTDILGSLEYATEVVDSKLIMVLGHTGCGAVKSACIGIPDMGNISPMLENLDDAVNKVKQEIEEENEKGMEDVPDPDPENSVFTNRVATTNVYMTIANMVKDSEIIKARAASPTVLRIVGAMYDVSTGKVTPTHNYNPKNGKVEPIA